MTGIRVLDFGILLAGPRGARLLGEFGAEVIQVEKPKTGDSLRGAAKNDEAGNPVNWLIEARNKKSITLNLRSTKGQEIIKELACVSDVLFENFQPWTLKESVFG